MSSKPFKPTLQETSLIEWLLSRPEMRFAVHYGNSGVFHLCERTTQVQDGQWAIRRLYNGSVLSSDDQAVLDRFGGKLKFDAHNLKSAGLVEILAAATQSPDERQRFKEATADIKINGSWGFDSAIVVLTPAAAAWWEEKGRGAQEKLLNKSAVKKAKMAEKERVAVFGACRWLYGVSYAGKYAGDDKTIGDLINKATSMAPQWQSVRPSFSAVIARETATRYYLRDIVYMTDFRLQVGGDFGRDKEKYVDKEFLLLDNATPEDIARLVEFDKGLKADYAQVLEKFVDDVIPTMIDTYGQSELKSAELKGAFGELLASMSKDDN